MNIADELKNLADLHHCGRLTDKEFAAAARDAVIAGGNATDESEVEAQIEKLRRQRSEIEQLDRDWEIERENYIVIEKFGDRTIPSRWGSIVNVIAIVVFGIAWVVISVRGETPVWFPIFGAAACAAGIAACVHRYRKASAHDAAYERYQRRRADLQARTIGTHAR